MTAVLLEQVQTPPVTGERRVTSGPLQATMQWAPDAGVRFVLPARQDLRGSEVRQYASFLQDVAENQSVQFDLENQRNSVRLEDHGFMPVRDDERGGQVCWVSQSASLPLAFGTPMLSWESAFNYSQGRACARLELNAVGLPHALPLRAQADWNDAPALAALLARAHAIDTYLVEVALLDSDYIRSANTRWLQDRRAQEFAAQLPRTAHVKHSRLARILRNLHGRASAQHSTASHGHLSVFDFPGARTVPLIGLRRFDTSAIRATLAEEGLSPLPPFGDDAFWNNVVRQQWTFWAADPTLFDPQDTYLMGWLNREIRARCSFASHDRRYPI